MNLLEPRKVNIELERSKEFLDTQNILLAEQSQKLAHEIDRIVNERTKEIATQNVTLEEMNKELQAFNYISIHDLHEPLRKIQTFTSLIIDKESEGLSERGSEYLSKIEAASSRMRSLIADLLAYSRATFAEKVFQQLTLKEVVDCVKSNMAEEIEEKNATVELLSDCDIMTIPYQMEQLIYNLVSNSLKFSKLGIKPRLKNLLRWLLRFLLWSVYIG
jgi:light-regulated signal transduction histidine kinase (bacteriophytochrome)